MQSRVNDCIMRHDMGFNCAQSVACTYADLVGCDKQTIFKMTEGLGLGMGGMQGTCGALSGACVLAGMKNSGGDCRTRPPRARPTSCPGRSSAASRKRQAPPSVRTSKASRPAS